MTAPARLLHVTDCHLLPEPGARLLGVDTAETLAAVLAQALDDPYSAVRAIAGESLRRHEGYADLDYDYTAPAEARQEVMRRVVERWEASEPQGSPEVFMDDDGLDMDLVRLMQTVRDDRPVVVSE